MRTKAPTLGDRLKEARLLSGLVARKIDELAHLREGHVAHIESGRRPNIETRTAEGLARVLGLSLDWLVLGRGPKPSAEGVKRAVAKAERQASEPAAQ